MVGRTWVDTICFIYLYAWSLTECWSYSGLLARMKWYRAVLDEAQFIRNRSVYYLSCLASKLNFVLQGHSGQQSCGPAPC
jgi:hypothetical protein